MSPQEFWLIADARQPQPKVGNLDADTFEELRSMLEEGKQR
jgi:hypothetical protein